MYYCIALNPSQPLFHLKRVAVSILFYAKPIQRLVGQKFNDFHFTDIMGANFIREGFEPPFNICTHIPTYPPS